MPVVLRAILLPISLAFDTCLQEIGLRSFSFRFGECPRGHKFPFESEDKVVSVFYVVSLFFLTKMVCLTLNVYALSIV